MCLKFHFWPPSFAMAHTLILLITMKNSYILLNLGFKYPAHFYLEFFKDLAPFRRDQYLCVRDLIVVTPFDRFSPKLAQKMLPGNRSDALSGQNSPLLFTKK